MATSYLVKLKQYIKATSLYLSHVLISILAITALQGTLVSAANTTTAGDNQKSIAILTMAPYSNFGEEDPGWPGGPAVIPAVRLAVDRINNSTDVLSGYHIQLLEGNSGCHFSTRTAHGFVSSISLDSGARLSSTVVGVIGPACSESAQFLGSLGAREELSFIQISPIATSPLLSDIDKYHNTFRMVGSALQHIEVLTELMALNSWENVAVLHDRSHLYFQYPSEVLINTQSTKIGFNSAIGCGFYPLGSIEAHFKVVFLIARGQALRETLCLAYYHQPKMIYPVYQWILVDHATTLLAESFSFRHKGRLYNCTEEVMMEALEGAIITQYQLQELSNHPTDVNLTGEQYQELYPKYLNKHLDELRQNERDASYQAGAEMYGVAYYDATWALALALNASLERIQPATLADYGLGQPQTTEIIRQELHRLQFTGLMGKTSFQGTQESTTPININQFIRGESTLVGIYNDTVLRIVSEEANFVSEVFHRAIVTVHPIVTLIFLTLVGILSVYTISLHLIFIIHYDHKSIKAASFALSHFMFSGCYVILLQVLLTVLMISWMSPTSQGFERREIITGIHCNINEWLSSIGISLILATLCGELWRIYRIFHYFKTNSYLISDHTLTAFIVVVVGVNVALLTVWTTVDPLLAKFEQQDIEYNGQDEPVLQLRGFCYCKYFTLWTSATNSVIILILTGVVILSALNRRISRKYFQMAKSVNMMVYMISPACFLGNALAFIFQRLDIHYTYIVWQTALLTIVCFVCVFIFTPPAYSALGVRWKPPCLKNP